MSFTGESGEINAVFRPAADLPASIGKRAAMRYVATGAVTRGEFGLFLREMQPGAGGPKAHFHRTFSESFYVVEGTVRIYDGQRWVDATAGDFVYVPPGGIHAFSADSDEPSAMLILFAPGAQRERYFEELVAIERSGRRLSRREWNELYARHDQYMVG